jgi:peptide/nickel transport system ATP-binding protein
MSNDLDNVLEIRNLRTQITSRGRAVNAVDGVDLTVGRGEVVALVGESGSGKTMTALSVMRLLPRHAQIVSGSIMFGGVDLTTATQLQMNRVRGGGIGLLFQQPRAALDPTCKVGSQVSEGYRLHRSGRRRNAWRRGVDLLTDVGIPEAAHRASGYAHQLSGGMAQRVMIASALSGEPALLIADEPTTSLDVTVQAQILRLLVAKTAELGMSLLLITHDLGVVARVAHRVAVMYSGRIVEEGRVEDICAAPQHPYTRALMRASLLERDDDGTLFAIPGSFASGATASHGCRFCHRCSVAQDLGIGERCSQEEPELVRGNVEHAIRCWASETAS